MAKLSQDRIAHLGMIQAVISRMAGESARMKQFALAAIGVLASAAEATGAPALAHLAGLLAVLFGLLDARYLEQERWYRDLYDEVREGDGPADFAMSPGPEIRRRNTMMDALTSWSVGPLYLALLIASVLLAGTVGSPAGG